MKVTPLDIRRKEFKRSMRGYSEEEVDVFLDEVADEFERLFQENIELADRVQRLDEQMAGHAQLREALEKTLISAQIQSDEMKANARKEGELILQEAELKARGIVNESYNETQRVQQSLIQLKHLEEDFRFKFRSLLEGHLQLLKDATLPTAAAATPGIEEETPQEAEFSPAKRSSEATSAADFPSATASAEATSAPEIAPATSAPATSAPATLSPGAPSVKPTSSEPASPEPSSAAAASAAAISTLPDVLEEESDWPTAEEEDPVTWPEEQATKLETAAAPAGSTRPFLDDDVPTEENDADLVTGERTGFLVQEAEAITVRTAVPAAPAAAATTAITAPTVPPMAEAPSPMVAAAASMEAVAPMERPAGVVAPVEAEEPPRGFFFGRPPDDLDDTFVPPEGTGDAEQKPRDFEW